MRFFILYLFIGGSLAFIAYHLYMFYLGLSSTRSVQTKDFKRLKDILTDVELTPWETGELNLLSRIGDADVERSIFGDLTRGIIYSIYHEPLIAFAVKQYTVDQSSILMVRINDNYYSYSNGTGDNVQEIIVAKNDNRFGDIRLLPDLSISADRDKLVIENGRKGDLLPVYFNEKQIVTINAGDSLQQSRVINVLSPFGHREEELFLILLSYGIIDKHL